MYKKIMGDKLKSSVLVLFSLSVLLTPLIQKVNQASAELISVQIGAGTLDSTRVTATKSEKSYFTPSHTGEARIELAWDSNADLSFSLFDSASGTKLDTVNDATKPKNWVGNLTAGTEYYVNSWSKDGIANYTLTLHTEVPDAPSEPQFITKSDVIDYATADYDKILGAKFTKVNFMVQETGPVTIELEWTGNEQMNLSIFNSETNEKLGDNNSTDVSPKSITLNLEAGVQYHANTWITSGTSQWVMRRIQTVTNPDYNSNDAPDAATKPNIVLINSDDQRDDSVQYLQYIQTYLAEKGVSFTNAIVPTPSCCPSRATTLSGQYVHNNGQFAQQTENAPIFEKTVQKYLKEAGYFTGHAGKYLHWVDTDEGVAPYWDKWTNIKGGYYGVKMNFDGQEVRPGGYTTDIVFERTKDYLREFEATNDDNPWFVYLAPMAPHSPYTAEYDLKDTPVNLSAKDPSYLEEDISDKPSYFEYRSMDDLAAQEEHEGRIRSLYSLDREVKQLVEHLENTGELSNTMIIFTSDNGYMLGEHQTRGKFTPYRKSVQVPMIISWPGHVEENTVEDKFVSHVDIVPTILSAAGYDYSQLSLDGKDIFSDYIRDTLYMEYFYDPDGNSGRIDTWYSIRTSEYQYTEWHNDNYPSSVIFREYYDMVNDPYQLNNLYENSDLSDDPDYIELSNTLATYRSCSGSNCSL